MPDFPCIFKTTVNFSVKRMAVKVPFRSYLISVHRLWKIFRYSGANGTKPLVHGISVAGPNQGEILQAGRKSENEFERDGTAVNPHGDFVGLSTVAVPTYTRHIDAEV